MYSGASKHYSLPVDVKNIVYAYLMPYPKILLMEIRMRLDSYTKYTIRVISHPSRRNPNRYCKKGKDLIISEYLKFYKKRMNNTFGFYDAKELYESYSLNSHTLLFRYGNYVHRCYYKDIDKKKKPRFYNRLFNTARSGFWLYYYFNMTRILIKQFKDKSCRQILLKLKLEKSIASSTIKKHALTLIYRYKIKKALFLFFYT